MDRIKIAIFLDAENLTQWLKNGGSERLLEELSSIGQIIVRRAYGKWTNSNLQSFQRELNRQGFELIHNFHPVRGKNSSDIQLTVDVMEYALRLENVAWFVLATGDSDFSPLFRRLREMGKEVVGVGPRSPLSESVKTSCSKYIYTDTITTDQEILISAIDDATDLAEKALQTFDGPALCSALKESMTNIDSAFDEKLLGFKSFTNFLKSIDSIEVNSDPEKNIWYACLKVKDDQVQQQDIQESKNQVSTEVLYQRILRKKGWRSIPTKKLINIYNKITELKPLTRNDIIESLLHIYNDDTTSADIKKAMAIFMKSKLFESENNYKNLDVEEKLWIIKAKDNFLRDVDLA